MASQDVGRKTQPVFKGTYESTKAHKVRFIPTAIWLWDRERRQNQRGFLVGCCLYFTQWFSSFFTTDLLLQTADRVLEGFPTESQQADMD